MKRNIFVISLMVIVSLLAGCGARQKLEDKVAEKLVEGALGGNVDIKGDEVTIKGEGGDVTIGGTEWPDSEIAKQIPEFKDGKITSSMKSDNYMLIVIEEVKEKDFKPYYEKIKSEFTENSYDAQYDDTIMYTASNDKAVTAVVSYNTAEETLTIQVSKVEETE